MAKIERLPVQHPGAPHCPNCKRDLPNLNGVSCVGPYWGDVQLLAILFHVLCLCGAEWCLEKKVKR